MTVVDQPITWSPEKSACSSASAKHRWLEVWPGVWTARDRPPVAGHDLAVGQAEVRREGEVDGFLADQLVVGIDGAVRSEGDGRRAGLLAQPGRERRVVGVAVGHEDVRDLLAGQRGGERVAVGVEDRPGVDHGDAAPPDQVGARAAVGEPRRVLGHDPADAGADLFDRAVAHVERWDEGDVRHRDALVRPGRAARRPPRRRRRPGSRRQPRFRLPLRLALRPEPLGSAAGRVAASPRSGGSRPRRARDPTR